MPAVDILVSKANLTEAKATEVPTQPLADGQARLRVERLALTANTVTYAVAGDAFGYWRFFPAPEGQGKVPAWGYGVVEDSKAEGLRTGERIYGYFPLASHVTIDVAKLDETGFFDGAEHRRGLAPVYNRYERVSADPSYAAADEAVLAAFRPLFTTGFLIDAMLDAAGNFGAEQVLISSASSKTSYSLAFLAKARGAKTVGLTGAKNKAFVEGLSFYDTVVAYEDLGQLNPNTPTSYVDMAGSADITRAVHAHFGDVLKHSAVVGVTHWTAPRAEAPPPGIAPSLFFAPDHVTRLTKEWGQAGFQLRVNQALNAFKTALGPRLTVRHVEGPQAVAEAFAATASGAVDPAEILTVRV
jgi:NADPH:quinone reductase-like Zn-dependent oxidoreductase